MTEPFIALDTETTGLSHETDRVLELALREFNPETGVVDTVRFKHWLINPQQPVPAQATKVHGITNEMLVDKPVFADVAEEFLEFCAGKTLVIHNAPFDEGMLNAELLRLGKDPLADHVDCIVDTLAISRKLKNGNNTLDALCDKFGVDRSIRVTHGALTDCDLLAQVYPFLIQQQAQFLAPFKTLLNFDFQADIAAKNADTLISEILSIEDIIGFLEDLKKRRTKSLKESLSGEDHSGPYGKVVFSPRTNTNWSKVVEDFLKGVDLKKYQKATSAMYVKPLSDDDKKSEESN